MSKLPEAKTLVRNVGQKMQTYVLAAQWSGRLDSFLLLRHVVPAVDDMLTLDHGCKLFAWSVSILSDCKWGEFQFNFTIGIDPMDFSSNGSEEISGRVHKLMTKWLDDCVQDNVEIQNFQATTTDTFSGAAIVSADSLGKLLRMLVQRASPLYLNKKPPILVPRPGRRWSRCCCNFIALTVAFVILCFCPGGSSLVVVG